jgi:hypothetical protein
MLMVQKGVLELMKNIEKLTHKSGISSFLTLVGPQ